MSVIVYLKSFSNSLFAKVMKEFDGGAVVQFFRYFNMLPVGQCSEARLFRHLTNCIFCSLWFRKYITFEGVTISTSDMEEKILKIFSFLDNCSWIGCYKFFRLRREYLPSAINLLTNTSRISDTLRRTFSNSLFAKVMKQYDRSDVVQIFRLFYMLTVARCSETRLFRHLTNHLFHIPNFENT